jgi:hypothetical protein
MVKIESCHRDLHIFKQCKHANILHSTKLSIFEFELNLITSQCTLDLSTIYYI